MERRGVRVTGNVASGDRVVSPPLDQLDRLRTPLTEGERIFLDFLLAKLPAGWEIYVQPHMNGLRPDFVLLHPDKGMAVYEVKDWHFDSMAYSVERHDDRLRLMATSARGKVDKSRDNPVTKVDFYKREIHQLYCPRSPGRRGFGLITAGIVFPFEPADRVKSLFAPFRDQLHMSSYPGYYPVIGNDTLESGDILAVLPRAAAGTSNAMTAETASDLRSWLVEPEYSAEQRKPLETSADQRKLITTRTDSGYRKIKGSAGAGKSLVVAARASQLASEGKEVLVVSYNITLVNYLKDLAVRWPAGAAQVKDWVTWLNFHAWCKRVCNEAGELDRYYGLWRGLSDDAAFSGTAVDDRTESILSVKLPSLVNSVLASDGGAAVTKYDAILVDEGQDLRLEWWNCLRGVLKDGGEMVLVADTTQDIYGVAKFWTDEKMNGSGLVGAWNALSGSYRLPDSLIVRVRDYAEAYLPSELRDLPESPPDQADFFTSLRWVQVRKDDAEAVAANEVIRLAPSADPRQLAMADVTLLSATKETGAAVVADLEKLNVKFLHTFSDDPDEGDVDRPHKAEDDGERRRKLAFFKGDARLKATTLHSFKGWESRSIVMYTGSAWTERSKALIYAGLTRLKKCTEGSYLTVVCAVDDLATYGRDWPEWVDYRSGPVPSRPIVQDAEL